MEKVCFYTNSKCSVDDLDDSDFIGVRFKGGLKGYVQKFKGRYLIGMTSKDSNLSSYHNEIMSNNIKTLLKKTINIIDVYTFKNKSFLLRWLMS